ncbi:MAG: glycosyltransferase, partial [Solirubrobacteraceae bacterium]
KGQDIFLRAFARAFAGQDVTAVLIGSAIFGEEDYAQQLRDLVEILGIAGQVEFRGFRHDVGAEYRRLDVMVHASVLDEPLGTVIFEAMAAGLPVIAADAGGPREYIRHGHDGLLHEPGNVQHLADTLLTVSTNAALRRDLAANARERAHDFAPERIATMWVDLYQRALASVARTGGTRRRPT